jgi:hypothetical protein
MNSQTKRMKNNQHLSLKEIGKELPFGVPDNYFDQFASQFEDKIGYGGGSSRKMIRPWMYMAATFVGVLLMAQIFSTIYQNNTARNAENYELYVVSQVDEAAIMDCYMDDAAK